MKLKSQAALLIALIFAITAAVSAGAEGETFATYIQPDGVNICEAQDLGYFSAPIGLQPMYTIMQNVNPASSTYIFVMPNGRALLSVSSIQTAQEGSAQSLMELWDAIALGLQSQAQEVNTDPSCVQVCNQYGQDAIRIQTTLTFDASLTVAAEGVAFYQGSTLTELWTVQPEGERYAPSSPEDLELKQDLDALEALKSSLEFDVSSLLDNEAWMESTHVYQDPAGAFDLSIPNSTVVITAATDQETVAAAQARYAAMQDGGELVFTEWYQDVTESNATLLLIEEYGLSCLIFQEDEPIFRDATLKTYYALAENIRTGLEKRFGIAQLLQDEGTMTISGLDHAWLNYWLRTQKTDVVLNVFAVTDENGLLREVDLFTVIDQPANEALQQNAIRLLLETLHYTAPTTL